MSLQHIVFSDYGQEIQLTFIDVDTDAAADISSYSTSQKMIFTDPAGTETEVNASFETDGEDGVISWTVTEDFFSVGIWSVRGQVTTATAVLTTVEHKFRVIA